VATDAPQIASEAMAARREGFDVLMLREDRAEVARSHMRGERRREADELLHLQLLDLGLLAQARTHTPRVYSRAHTTRCTRTVHGAPRAPLPGTSPYYRRDTSRRPTR